MDSKNKSDKKNISSDIQNNFLDHLEDTKAGEMIYWTPKKVIKGPVKDVKQIVLVDKLLWFIIIMTVIIISDPGIIPFVKSFLQAMI